MQTNKLFNVNIVSGEDRLLGVIKAENFSDALEYLKIEYPTYTIESIEEGLRILL